jgi:hypothetical protein
MEKKTFLSRHKWTRWEKIWWPVKHKLEAIRDFFWYDIPRGIPNLIAWIPVIWQDRQWDYYNIYGLLEKKLERLDKFWSVWMPKHKANNKWSLTERDKKNAKDIKTCLALVRRLQEDDYVWNNPDMYPAHDKKFGSMIDNMKFDESVQMWSWKSSGEAESKDTRRIVEYGEYMKKQDKALLYKLLSERMEYWWD